MKKFISKVLLFLFLLFIPILLVELSIKILRKNIFEEKVLEKRFKFDANSYTWLEKLSANNINIVTGSSTVRYGLSCKELNKLNPDNSMYVSLAVNARDPIQTYFILKNIGLNNVKNIFFGLDPWIFSRRYYKHRTNYLYLDFSLKECFSFFIEYDKSVFSKRYISFFKYLFNISSYHMKKETIIPKDFGSVPLNRTAVNFNDKGDWFQIEKYGWSNLQFEYLKKIENFCIKNKINFSLFIVPKRSDYLKFYLENHKLTHIDYTNKLAEVGIKSPIFGKLNLLDNDNDSIFFAEAYHLNQKGQIKFSKLFYKLSIQNNKNFSKKYKWYTEYK